VIIPAKKMGAFLVRLWERIEGESEQFQKEQYQLIMNKSISAVGVTDIEGIYLDRYVDKFSTVVAHERELVYSKIFLCEGG